MSPCLPHSTALIVPSPLWIHGPDGGFSGSDGRRERKQSRGSSLLGSESSRMEWVRGPPDGSELRALSEGRCVGEGRETPPRDWS